MADKLCIIWPVDMSSMTYLTILFSCFVWSRHMGLSSDSKTTVLKHFGLRTRLHYTNYEVPKKVFFFFYELYLLVFTVLEIKTEKTLNIYCIS